MAITVNLYDLENYPDNPKRGTVDVVQMVPTGYRGDEQYVLKFATTAYSDVENKTSIADIYIQEMACGWAKSSGFTGMAGKFTITSSTNKLRVNIDGATSGSYAGFYEIILEEGVNGRFMIQSGSVSNSYVGANKSSVKVFIQPFAESATETLGFDKGVDSEYIATTSIKEVVTTSNYTVGGSTLAVGNGLGVVAGDALSITDGVNTDYFVAVSGTTDISIHVPNQSEHNFNAISNDYTAGSKVQLMRSVDPEMEPVSALSTVDMVCRWGVMSLINQIDFSG